MKNYIYVITNPDTYKYVMENIMGTKPKKDKDDKKKKKPKPDKK